MDTWKATQLLLELRNQAPRLQPMSVIDGGSFPMSFAQERMFELAAVEPGVGAHNLAYAYELRGRVEPDRLGEALTSVVRRQAVLRSHFARIAGRLVQTVQPPTPIVLEVEPLTSTDPAEQRRLVAAAGAEPFALEREPPFRARLFGLAPNHHVLSWSFDRIIYDQQSEHVFMRELMAAYGDPRPLAEPTVHYVDFCVWQREWLSRPELIERLLAYWRPQLRDSSPLPAWPQGDRTATERGPAQTRTTTICAALARQLETTARGLGQTSFAALLTGFMLGLRELTGADDLAVCSSYINRSSPGTSRLIGDFSNLVILRADLSDLDSYADALSRVGASVAGALAYQDMPLRFVADDGVRLPRVMFVLHNAPQRELSLPGLELATWALPPGTDNFDLFVAMRPSLRDMPDAGEVQVTIRFKPGVVPAATIAALENAMLEQLACLANDSARGPSRAPRLTPESPARRAVGSAPAERLSDAALAAKLHDELVREGLPADPSSERPRYPADFDVHAEQLLVYLLDASAEMFGVRLQARQSLRELDLDSLSAIQFANRLRRDLRANVPITAVLGDLCWAELAVEVTRAVRASDASEHALSSIEPVDRKTPLPLSFDQAQLWRQATTHEVSHLHVVPFELEIEGAIEPELLGRGLSLLADRHESLRTAIVVDRDGCPRQVISAALPIPLPLIDLSALARPEALAELDAIIERERTTLFELSQPPLWRATLVRLRADSHRMVVCMHHIIMDGYSIGLFHRDLAAICRGLLGDRTSTLEPLAIHCADFAVWQRRMFTPELLHERLEGYRRLLTPAPRRLGLPTKTERPPGHVFTAKVLPFEIEPEHVRALRVASRRSGATIFMLALAAFVDVLRRHAPCEDVCVGVPTNKRYSHATEPVIGYFSDQSILRIDVRDQPDLAELVTRVREMTQSALANQDISLANVLHELGLPAHGELDGQPYDVFFNEIPWAPALEIGDATMVPRFTPRRTIVFDITVLIREVARPTGAVIEGVWRYREELFEAELMAAMLRDFRTSLAALGRHDDPAGS